MFLVKIFVMGGGGCYVRLINMIYLDKNMKFIGKKYEDFIYVEFLFLYN